MGVVTRDLTENGRYLNTLEIPSLGFSSGQAIGAPTNGKTVIVDRGTAWLEVEVTNGSGDAAASVTLETSFDGAAWTAVGAAMGPGKHVRSGVGPYVRVVIDATGTSGTVDVKVDAELV